MNQPIITRSPQTSRFSANKTDEVFFAFHSTPHPNFIQEAKAALSKYFELQQNSGCSEDTEILLRFHLSNIAEQEPILRGLLGSRNSFVSFVGQPPTDGAALAIEAYHILATKDGLKKKLTCRKGSLELNADLANYSKVFFRQPMPAAGDGPEQITREFSQLNDMLTSRKGSLQANCVRTWLYVRDIDYNYDSVAAARRRFFDQMNLTRDTHYIASTGICGDFAAAGQVVGMDSLSVFGLKPDQIEFMHALDHMPPTYIYNVTFERGTRLCYGDRSHYYISGTASIDARGRIMHRGDAGSQTKRTVENISALLSNHGASLDELKIAVIYVRNSSDASAVIDSANAILPVGLPRIILTAPICRRDWLLEIEGIAVNNHGDERFLPFA